MNKATRGRFFEDFALGETIRHATPRTITLGDVAVYQAIYGNRFAVQSSDPFAQSLGYPRAPVDDLLLFHIVFGKTVPDVSLNAVANLGYADCRFEQAVFPGDTLSAESEVIGLKETSAGDAGIVYVRTCGFNQAGAVVLTYVRWVMVRKRDRSAATQEARVPDLPSVVGPECLGGSVPHFDRDAYDESSAGSIARYDDYAAGERIDHVDGITVEEAEHQMAARLYQNVARVHFNLHAERQGRFGKRLVYGGHVISTARALTFNGLGNAFHIAAINAGRHVAPCFAGDTLFAWSEVLEKSDIANGRHVGALRLRTVAAKDRPCEGFPFKDRDGGYDPSVVLDLDYWVLMPR
jgi:2-methylfumaryl-CoA hydratase